jgi:hypothetical protein
MGTTKRVKWKNELKAAKLCEMNGLLYRLTNTIIAVGKDGGYIAITIDRTVELV